LRFNSSKLDDEKGLISLEEYSGRMEENQKEIYYFSAPSREAAEMDPHLEVFRKKDIEILYLFDPIDEFVLTSLNKYKELPLVSADQVDLKNLKDLKTKKRKKSESKNENKKSKKEIKKLLTKIKEILGDRVEDVRFSERLTSSPAVLVSKDGGMSAQMEKIFNMMNENKKAPVKVLELNADHSILQNLATVFEKDEKDEFIEKTAVQLLEGALLLDGYLQDPHELVNHMQEMLATATELYAQKK